MVEATKLTKCYGSVCAINDLSFFVDKGETLGFLGPNGAGKSTTMKILTCFFMADSGTALIEGIDVFKDSVGARKRIGYMHENAPFYPEMRVEDTVCFTGRMYGMRHRELKKRLEYVLELFKLGNVRKKRMSLLSKGFRQRVAFAQAIVHDPDVLILDEPTNGLDPNQIFELRNIVKDLAVNKSLIYCSHNLAEVSAVCDRLLIIVNGKRVAMGSQSEINRDLLGGRILKLSVMAEKDISDILSRTHGIKSIENIGEEKKNIRNYKLTYNYGTDPREDIFSLAVNMGFKIYGMSEIELDLEGIFRKLTHV